MVDTASKKSNLDTNFFAGIDLKGRVGNYALKPTDPTKAILPILEAVVNSIHSIEESGRSDGEIEILIERADQQSSIVSSKLGSEAIANFAIKDNGVGFDDSRFKAFVTSDTSYKQKKGGKGIGRFSWLTAFQYASIKSIYQQSGVFYIRNFDFRLTEKGIHNLDVEEIEPEQTQTCVRLVNYNKKFKSACPKTSQSIAYRIIEYCLLAFLEDSIPLIRLIDASKNETHILNDIFKSGIKADIKDEKFKCGKYTFYLKNVKIYSASEDADHRIYLCGQKREVERISLHRILPFLQSRIRIQDEDAGKGFIYAAYVFSDYLDENVNHARTEFDISRHQTPMLEDNVSRDEIVEKALEKVKLYLKPFIEATVIENQKRIDKYIYENPKYKFLLEYKKKKLQDIPPNLTDDQLEIFLFKIYLDFELENKEKTKKFLRMNLEQIDDLHKHKEKYQEFISESNALGKSKLTDYVIQRKAILDLLDQRISLKSSGSYYYEEDVHAIIFPMKKTSKEVPYDQQNLWIIDEKLSYHYFLASDKPFSTFEEIKIESEKRSDLAIFDIDFAFAEEAPYSSITIIEFKRPMRDEYAENENPIDQVYNYIDEIRNGSANDKTGKMINIGDNVPVYVYVVCDITKKIKAWVKKASIFTPYPNNDGYFGYSKDYKAFIEVISFQKMVIDAKKRNAVLFDQLGIR